MIMVNQLFEITSYKMRKKHVIIFTFLLASFNLVVGQSGNSGNCQIDGVSEIAWLTVAEVTILDTAEGVVFERSTADIEEITLISPLPEEHFSAYISATLSDGLFTIRLLDEFEYYEENETSMYMQFDITFKCTRDSRIFRIRYNIQDTNNHDPIFHNDNMVFEIFTPMPAGLTLTPVFGNIIARDVDLTTSRVNFAFLEANNYLDISYSSRDGKNFFASLTVKSPITSLSEPVKLQISATDVDETGDPRRITFATVTLQVDPDLSIPTTPIFNQPFYRATYDKTSGLEFVDIISIVEGYNENLTIRLAGDNEDLFKLQNLNETITITTDGIPDEIIEDNDNLLFLIIANITETISGNAVIQVTFPSGDPVVFHDTVYEGTYQDGEIDIPPINIVGGYTENVIFTLAGEYSYYFEASYENDQVLLSSRDLSSDTLEGASYILLILQAIKPDEPIAAVTVVLRLTFEDMPYIIDFEKPLYTGSYTLEPLTVEHPTISILGDYENEITLSVYGEYGENFEARLEDGNVVLSILSALALDVVNNRSHILLVLNASTEDGGRGFTALSINLPSLPPVIFNQNIYDGQYLDNGIELPPIIVEGYTEEVTLDLLGEHSNYFGASYEDNQISINTTGLPDSVIDTASYVSLTLQAAKPGAPTAMSTIILSLSNEDDAFYPMHFEERLYTAVYVLEPLSIQHPIISFIESYPGDITLHLDGEYSANFEATLLDGSVVLSVVNALPTNIINDRSHIVLFLEASITDERKGSTIISIDLPVLDSSEGKFSFEHPLYEGQYEEELLQLPRITFKDDIVDQVTFKFSGIHSEYFTASFDSDTVLISVNLPDTVLLQNTYLVLELEASSIRLGSTYTILHILLPEADETIVDPTISFSAPQYVITVQPTQVGHLLNIQATADNGETLTYALTNLNDHLSERLHIDSRTGAVSLSAFANTGFYQLTVRATTVISQITAEVNIELTVNSVTDGAHYDYQLDPLTILEIIEKRPYNDVVVLNANLAEECKYDILEQWPADQDWFYTNDDGGISCHSVNREHQSIAFMTLSQIQLELQLNCNGNIRSLQTPNGIVNNKTVALSSSKATEEGTLTWIVAKNIYYSSSHRVVNIIVHDINDNPPIFTEEDPVLVGYPVSQLTDTLKPPFLTIVHATDADIGINAKIRYSTNSTHFTIHPESGVIYPRENFNDPLTSDISFIVTATDEDGSGPFTTPITIRVTLLDTEHISRLIVKGAYLENVAEIISLLSLRLGCQVKSLNSAVLPGSESTRQYTSHSSLRDIENDTESDEQLPDNLQLLRMYIYAFDSQTNLISADFLSEEIQSNINSSIGFEFTVESIPLASTSEIREDNSTNLALLYSVITLSVLLILLILYMAIKYLWTNRKKKYNQFQDTSSNQSESIQSNVYPDKLSTSVSSPVDADVHDATVLSLNLERILTPAPSVSVKNEITQSGSQSSSRLQTPIIQQNDILNNHTDLSEDEFGEVHSHKRKSVAFNELVESIQIDDNDDTLLYRL